ncbi:MAG: hypothetical protein DDT23_01185 [candidate division WS2 bacterium]|nr:hypothetical protein [Candidatus Lithacetigena glycinireducens]
MFSIKINRNPLPLGMGRLKYLISIVTSLVLVLFLADYADSVSPHPHPYSGSAFFAVRRADIGTISVNMPFGFTSKKIAIETSIANTDDVCVDWIGGTAACPAVNAPGDDRIPPGRAIILDEYSVSSLSFIAASGTQTIFIRAWR